MGQPCPVFAPRSPRSPHPPTRFTSPSRSHSATTKNPAPWTFPRSSWHPPAWRTDLLAHPRSRRSFSSTRSSPSTKRSALAHPPMPPLLSRPTPTPTTPHSPPHQKNQRDIRSPLFARTSPCLLARPMAPSDPRSALRNLPPSHST